MDLKKLIKMVVILAGSCVLLTACGGSEKSSADTRAYESAAENYDSSELTAYAEDTAESSSAQVGETAQSTNRKLIKNVDLNVETMAYDSLMKNLEEEIEALGGYIESMNAYNGSRLGESGSRNASITARIPAARLESFIDQVGEEGNITNRSESVEDVTLTYVDMESHKKMLTQEQERLLELLDSAATIEDIITIESRLSEVRYQIESMESQLRTFDNQVDYSTVRIYVDEVVELTPVEEVSAMERIGTGFMTSLRNVIRGIKEFFIRLIIALPYLVVLGIVIVIVVFVFKKISAVTEKRSRQLAEKRKEKMAQSPAGQKAVSQNQGYPFETKSNPEQTKEKEE